MKNPVYEQIQARKVKARLRMLQHAQRVSGNVSQTCRFFGVSRALFYIWKKRFEKNGLAGLRDQPRRPHHIRYRIPPEIVSLILRIREECRYGAVRASLYLQRHYHAYVSPTTILKIFHRHRVGRISLKKYRPGPKPADAPLQVPGRSVQLDVKFVPRVGKARQRFYQFTAIDEATRFRVLRIYDHNNTKTAIDFLSEVREHFPFAIQKIQTDNDSSFGPQFTWHLADLSISHRHIATAISTTGSKKRLGPLWPSAAALKRPLELTFAGKTVLQLCSRNGAATEQNFWHRARFEPQVLGFKQLGWESKQDFLFFSAST